MGKLTVERYLLVAALLLQMGFAHAASTKHALLIGISDYSASGLTSLPGSANDIKATKKVLIETLEFDPENIDLLVDDQASHSRIVDAFRALDERVSEGDFVYIHYSGHGSYVPDLNGDEARGLDQTWVSYGARSKSPENPDGVDNFDLLDDEISHWLAPVYAKAGQLVFVSDSCHSGTVSRGAEAPVQRAAPNDSRMHPLGMKKYRKADFSRGVQIGSTEDTKPAFEIKKEGESYGLFTWHWLNALGQATPENTWGDLFKSTEARIKANARIRQRPQISGQQAVTVLGGEFKPSASAVAVTSVRGDKVTIDAGSLSGITAGSVFVKKGDENSENSVKIERVRSFNATGVLSGTLQQGDLLVLKEKFYPKPLMSVFVSGDAVSDDDSLLLERLRKSVSAIPGIDLAGNQSESDLVLYFLRTGASETGRSHTASNAVNLLQTLPGSVADGAPEVWVLDAAEQLYNENLKIPLANPETGLSLIVENLKRIRNVRGVKALGGSGRGKPKVDLEIVRLQEDSGCVGGEGFSCDEVESGTYKRYQPVGMSGFDGSNLSEGDIISFKILNRSKRPQYVYLLDIMPNGKIQVIYPSIAAGEEASRLDGGESRDLSDLSGRSEFVGLMADSAGTETIKLIVSTKAVNVQLLEQNAFIATTRGSGDLNPLEQLLKSNAPGASTQTRGTPIRMGGMKWSTGQFDFTVIPPEAVSKGVDNGMKTRGAVLPGGVEKFVRVQVFFGVNRNYNLQESNPGERFGNDRGKLRLGTLWVSIPPNHEPGKLESPSLLSLSGENPDEHVVMQSFRLMDEAQFASAVKTAAEAVPNQRMLLYIHGYNNSFEEAAKRTAQIAYDLNAEGVSYVPLLFTWPSGNSINPTEYTRAWTNKDWSIPDLVKFVEVAVDRTGISNVHVLAHSMGTNLFSSASVQLAYVTPAASKRFGEVILAAPDIDAETFYRMLMPGIDKVSHRTTVYTASQDVALYISKTVHSGYSRLGDSSEKVHASDGADVIDVSAVNTSDIGHGYYAAIKRLLDDIGRTLNGVDISNRDLQGVAAADGAADYWKFSD